MKTLFWMGLREVWRTKGRVILVAIILALQVSTIAGSYMALDSLTHTRDAYYEELDFADLEVSFTAAALDEMPTLEALRKIPGVKAVTRRYVAKGHIEDTPGGTPYPVTIVYVDPGGPPDVNHLKILEGRDISPTQKEEAVVDRGFARYRGVKIGDKLVVNPYAFPARFTITGVGLSPEFLAPTANPDVFLPGKGSLGILYASRQQLDEVFLDKLYNSLVFTYAPGQDRAEVQQRILAALSGLDVERIVPKTSNYGYRLVDESLRGARLLTPVLAIVIGLVAGIVAYVTVNRIVVNQRREIGALLAMGYPPRYFVFAYLLLGLVPGILGALLGAFWGIGLAVNMTENISRITGLPPALMRFDPGILAGGAATSVIVAVACTLMPLMKIVKLQPSVAIRGGNEISFGGLPPVIEALIGRGRAPTRYALRNMFRRKRLSLAVIILVSAAISVPVSLLTMNSSWIQWADTTTQKLRWDTMMTFKVGLKEDALHEILVTPGLKETEPFVSGRASLARPSGSRTEVRLRGIPIPERLEHVDLSAGRMPSGPDAMEIVVNEAVTRAESKPQLGEKVTLHAKGKAYEVTIVGLMNDAALTTVFIPLGPSQKILDLEGKVSGLYALIGKNPREGEAVKLPPMNREMPKTTEEIDFEDAPRTKANVAKPLGAVDVSDPESVRKALLREEMIVTVQSKRDTQKSTVDYMREYKDSTMQFTFISSTMAFLALLSVLALVFLERESEYATLRSMGYGTKEISRIVVTELAVLTSVGFLIALVGWYLLAAFFVELMSRTWFPIKTAYWGIDLATVAVPTTFLFILAVGFGIRSLMRLDLRSVLCSRAIG